MGDESPSLLMLDDHLGDIAHGIMPTEPTLKSEGFFRDIYTMRLLFAVDSSRNAIITEKRIYTNYGLGRLKFPIEHRSYEWHRLRNDRNLEMILSIPAEGNNMARDQYSFRSNRDDAIMIAIEESPVDAATERVVKLYDYNDLDRVLSLNLPGQITAITQSFDKVSPYNELFITMWTGKFSVLNVKVDMSGTSELDMLPINGLLYNNRPVIEMAHNIAVTRRGLVATFPLDGTVLLYRWKEGEENMSFYQEPTRVISKDESLIEISISECGGYIAYITECLRIGVLQLMEDGYITVWEEYLDVLSSESLN